MGATVAVMAEHGYESSRVADIIDLAGISRSAFYRHFANKRDCFVSTLDAMLEMIGPAVAHAYGRGEQPWDARLRSVFGTVVEAVTGQPAAARMWFVEVRAAGREAVERVERLGDRLEQLTLEAMAESPRRRAMPPHLIRAVLGGLRQIVQVRLRHDRQDELVELAPELLDWALGYRAPPRALAAPRRAPSIPVEPLDPSDARARTLAAVAEMVAENGYQRLVITEIAHRAGISLSTFYDLFDGKEDASVAAIEAEGRRLTETVLPVYRDAPDWPSAVRDGLHALFAFLTSNPTTALLGGREIYAGGTRALDRHESAMRDLQALLYGGYLDRPDVPPIVGEAIGGAVSSLIYQQLRRAGPDRLYEAAPTAAFVALAPFLGADEACALANAGWRPRG